MKCFFIKPTGLTRKTLVKGPGAVEIKEVQWIKDGYQMCWSAAHAPGLEFGPGAMFWQGDHLWLITPTRHMIDIDGRASGCLKSRSVGMSTQHKCRTREGIPPMITVKHNCSPVIWTLENGVFEAVSSGDRNYLIEVPNRS